MLLRFFDELGMLVSQKRKVDGLSIVHGEDKGAEAADRVAAALELIKDIDPVRYKRLLRDLKRIWIVTIPGAAGRYIESTSTCQLDDRFVLGEHISIEEIAGTIVHEATHARLMRCGIGYEEGLRDRVERVCMARELAFAAKLEDGSRIQRWVDARRNTPPDYSDTGLRGKQIAAGREALLHLDMPRWLADIVISSAERRFQRRNKKRDAGTASGGRG